MGRQTIRYVVYYICYTLQIITYPIAYIGVILEIPQVILKVISDKMKMNIQVKVTMNYDNTIGDIIIGYQDKKVKMKKKLVDKIKKDMLKSVWSEILKREINIKSKTVN